MRSFGAGIESWILSYLLNSLWQVPLLFAAGWIAARALRPTGAAAEHRAWVGVLLLESFLPACSTVPWEWLQTRFAWGSGALRASETHVSVIMGAGTGFGGFRLPSGLLAAIAIGYGIVSAYFIARFVWRWRRLYVIRQEAMEVALTGEAARYWAQCLKRFGIDGVSIAVSSRIFGPVTMGLSRKLVLLPANMISDLPEADIHAVIAHEFVHIHRNDFFKNVMYELLSLPVSYHPMFWLTRERVMESREIVCDQMAAEIDGRNQYARSLLRLASLLVEGAPARTLHAVGIFDGNAFERRLMRLTENQTEIRALRRFAVVVACAVFGIVTCGSAFALRMHVDAATANVSKTSGPIEISSGVMAKNRLAGPNPKYPEAAKKARIQGTVALRALIGKDGSVEKLIVISGPKELQKSSLDAVRQWTYRPFLLNGNAVEVETQINVVYSLRE